MTDQAFRETRRLMVSIAIVGSMALVMWGIHILSVALQIDLTRFGIYPRDLDTWHSIFTGPLIHGDWIHLMSNTLPLLMCGILLFWLYRSVSWLAFPLIYTLTGVAVWLFARPVYHIGFSGVAYGLVSFLFWVGVFRRDIKSIVISLAILVMYSGYFAGIYPNQEGISWESHLMGGLVGIAVALMLYRWIPADPVNKPKDDDVDEDDGRYFLPRDTFEPRDTYPGPYNWHSDDTR